MADEGQCGSPLDIATHNAYLVAVARNEINKCTLKEKNYPLLVLVIFFNPFHIGRPLYTTGKNNSPKGMPFGIHISFGLDCT